MKTEKQPTSPTVGQRAKMQVGDPMQLAEAPRAKSMGNAPAVRLAKHESPSSRALEAAAVDDSIDVQKSAPEILPEPSDIVLEKWDEREPGQPRRVEEYVRRALLANPEVAAARRALLALSASVTEATALEDPMLSSTIWPIDENSPQSASGRMPAGIMLSQQFPWFGELRLRGQVAQQEVRMARHRLTATQQAVVEAVKIAYYEIFFHQRALGILAQNEQLLEEMYVAADRLYQNNEASAQDALRAKVELLRIKDQDQMHRRQLESARADLAKELHLPRDADLAVADAPEIPVLPQSWDALYELAERCRPALGEQRHAVVRERRTIELSKRDYFPDVTPGIDWGGMTTDQAMSPEADGKDNLGFTLSMNLPVRRDRIRAKVRRAESRALEQAQRYESLRDETFRQIRRLSTEAETLNRQMALFQNDLVPTARETFQVARIDYEQGRIPFIQLVENWTNLLNFQIELTRLQASLAQTLASLEKVVGCTLDEVAEQDGSERRVD